MREKIENQIAGILLNYAPEFLSRDGVGPLHISKASSAVMCFACIDEVAYDEVAYENGDEDSSAMSLGVSIGTILLCAEHIDEFKRAIERVNNAST